MSLMRSPARQQVQTPGMPSTPVTSRLLPDVHGFVNGVTRKSLLALVACCVTLGGALAQTTQQSDAASPVTGPIRLRQPLHTEPARAEPEAALAVKPRSTLMSRPIAVGDFERYVRSLPGASDVRRFGSDLVELLSQTEDGADYNPVVPPDYVLRSGDELLVTLWGSIDGDLRLEIDRSGRIVIPRVGPVQMSGVRYADAAETISRRVSQVFKNFNVSVSLGRLHGVRIYVTGFAERPGPVVVGSLSTLVQAVMKAGGPSAAGSFRDISLRRGGAPANTFDLYDLLLKGNRASDLVLQPEDVVHIGPIGPQVAILGSVNRPAIYEMKAGESISDVLQMAGGYSAVADRSRVALARVEDRSAGRVAQLEQPAAGQTRIADGDVLHAFSVVESTQPVQRQNKRVRVEGEVFRPGEYVLPPNTSIRQALVHAGGLTANAYLYGTEFTRESVRLTQQSNYERAIRDFETQLLRASASQRSTSTEEAALQSASASSSSRLLEQLRALRPTGRIVLQVAPESGELPDLALEDGDRLYIPARPTTVGVFGSVFNAGSYLQIPNRSVGDYLRLAGGPTRSADVDSIFAVRANGSVISGLQTSGGWFSSSKGLTDIDVLPGDTIFVPDNVGGVSWVQPAKDWTQILYQFGLGLAGIRSVTR